MFLFKKDSVGDFIRSHAIAVMATVNSEGQPSSSTIFYTVSKNDEIWFLTKSDTTKYINLNHNSKASMTILDMTKPVAVNLTGHAVEVTDTKDKDEILQAITKLSNDTLHDYAPIIKLHKGAFRSMRFIPEQAKMTDYTRPLGQAGETLKEY